MVRVLDIRDQADVSSESRSSSNVQREASDLLNSKGLGKTEKPSSINNGMLEFTNAFSDSSSTCSRIPNDGSRKAPSDCAQRKQFVPDKELKTPGAREWARQSEQQRQKPLEVSEDGTYRVEKGDSLSTIAERMGRGEDGRRPDANKIRENVRRLLEANPELKCNPDYLREGRRLRIPGKEGSSQDACPAPADRPRLPQEKPDRGNDTSKAPEQRKPEIPNLPNKPGNVIEKPKAPTEDKPGNVIEKPKAPMDSAGTGRPADSNDYCPAPKKPDWKTMLPPPSWELYLQNFDDVSHLRGQN